MHTESVEERGKPKLQQDVYAAKCSVMDDETLEYDWNEDYSTLEGEYAAMTNDEIDAWMGAQRNRAATLSQPVPEAPEGVPLLYEGDAFTLSQGEAAWIPTILNRSS